MSPEDFEFFRRLLRERIGLNLTEEKGYLLETRLARVMRQHGIGGLRALAQRLERERCKTLEAEVIDAMTTNETFFFRDRTPFDHLRTNVLPALLAARAGQRRLAIWCAAAATGQEPYSIAMILDAMSARLDGWTVDILATDISGSALSRAREGVFSQFEVQRGLPIRMLLAHFERKGESTWRISQRIRDRVQFRKFNLMDDFTPLGRFDIVLCRNALMYFDQQMRQSVLSRLQHSLAVDGSLVLGSAETLIGVRTDFVSTGNAPGFYRLAGETRLASVA